MLPRMNPTTSAALRPRRRRCRRFTRLAAGLVAFAVPALAGLGAAAPAGASVGLPGLPPPPPVGKTIVAGTPNPANWDQPVTVVAHQCAYGFGHNPTGTIGFRDLNTDTNL